MDAVQRRLQQPSSGDLRGALSQIGREFDALLKHLIRHREHVIGDGDDDRTSLLTGFVERAALLDSAIGAIEGKDPELQLLALRLPPYDEVGDLPADASAFSVEEPFVTTLRSAPQPDEPVHEAQQLAQLLLGLLTPTPLRLKVRLLMANQLLQQVTPEVENAYERDASLEEARKRAQSLVERRLGRLSLNASIEERAALRKRGIGLVMSIEQRWLATQGDLAPDDGAESTESAEAVESVALDDLSDYEKSHDATFVTVSVRSGSHRQEVASVVMPDPDQPSRMLMAQRDSDSGKLVPQLRRNRRRYVEQQADGSWKALTG